MSLTFGGLRMELIFRKEREYELPIRTLRHIDMSDGAYFFEIILRIKKLFLGPDIIEVGILDDLFEVCLRLREEDCRHDDTFDLVYARLCMSYSLEPLTSDTRSDVFIFLILYRESRIMKECCELEILEVFAIDSLS